LNCPIDPPIDKPFSQLFPPNQFDLVFGSEPRISLEKTSFPASPPSHPYFFQTYPLFAFLFPTEGIPVFLPPPQRIGGRGILRGYCFFCSFRFGWTENTCFLFRFVRWAPTKGTFPAPPSREFLLVFVCRNISKFTCSFSPGQPLEPFFWSR